MRRLILFALIAVLALQSKAQSTSDILKQQAGAGVKQGANVATQTAANKVTDKVLGKLFGPKKQKNTSSTDNNSTASTSNQQNNSNSANSTVNVPESKGDLKTYSKFDFIPGEKVLAYDDFAKDDMGDYPATWNTNSTGEVVNSSARDGHMLMLRKQGKFIPEYI